jgi:hypothetical protein
MSIIDPIETAAARETFLERARRPLIANDARDLIKPGPHRFPHPWNRHAALEAMGLAHPDVARGREEARPLLAGTWSVDGPAGASDVSRSAAPAPESLEPRTIEA